MDRSWLSVGKSFSSSMALVPSGSALEVHPASGPLPAVHDSIDKSDDRHHHKKHKKDKMNKTDRKDKEDKRKKNKKSKKNKDKDVDGHSHKRRHSSPSLSPSDSSSNDDDNHRHQRKSTKHDRNNTNSRKNDVIGVENDFDSSTDEEVLAVSRTNYPQLLNSHRSTTTTTMSLVPHIERATSAVATWSVDRTGDMDIPLFVGFSYFVLPVDESRLRDRARAKLREEAPQRARQAQREHQGKDNRYFASKQRLEVVDPNLVRVRVMSSTSAKSSSVLVGRSGRVPNSVATLGISAQGVTQQRKLSTNQEEEGRLLASSFIPLPILGHEITQQLATNTITLVTTDSGSDDCEQQRRQSTAAKKFHVFLDSQEANNRALSCTKAYANAMQSASSHDKMLLTLAYVQQQHALHCLQRESNGERVSVQDRLLWNNPRRKDNKSIVDRQLALLARCIDDLEREFVLQSNPNISLLLPLWSLQWQLLPIYSSPEVVLQSIQGAISTHSNYSVLTHINSAFQCNEYAHSNYSTSKRLMEEFLSRDYDENIKNMVAIQQLNAQLLDGKRSVSRGNERRIWREATHVRCEHLFEWLLHEQLFGHVEIVVALIQVSCSVVILLSPCSRLML
jgi:hypothetical protein